MTKPDSVKSIKLIIDSNLEVVFLAGLAVRAFCSSVPLDEHAVYQVELSVIEAVNNAIKHAYGNERGHEVEILVSLHLDRLTFQICDFGQTLGQNNPQAIDFDPGNLDTLPESGMGLYVMKNFMDQVVYQRSGDRNIMFLCKYFEKK